MEETKRNAKYKILFFICIPVLLAVLVLFILSRMRTVHGIDADLKSLGQEIITLAGDGKLAEGSDMELKRNFSLIATDYTDVMYLSPQEFLSVDEILIIRCADAESVNSVYAAMQARQTRQMTTYENYGTNQYSLASDAVIYKNDQYAVYVCCEKAAEITALIKSRIER